jgi:hypothetical protein
MKCWVLFLLVLAMWVGGCGNKSNAPANPATNASTSSSSGNPLTAPVDYLGAVGKAQQNAIKTVDVASLNQAIQLFNVDHGRNPKDLNELVQEKFIPQLPAAPYGMKLDYDPTSGKVSVVKQ